jgi:hypothetical protein
VGSLSKSALESLFSRLICILISFAEEDPTSHGERPITAQAAPSILRHKIGRSLETHSI